MRILIIGANGQLGRALRKTELIKNNETFFASHCGDGDTIGLDITSEDEVTRTVQNIFPEVIINCAAYNKVEQAEQDSEEAYRTNTLAVRYLAKAAESVQAHFVHISTDFVFDGKKDRPYVETDKKSPLSVYAKSKSDGEDEALKGCSKTLIVRTAWLYGEGHNFVRTILSLAKTHEELKVVSDQTGSPTSAKELAEIVTFLVGKSQIGIVNGVCEGSATWHELASEAVKLAGMSTKVLPVTTKEYGSKVERPQYSVLSTEKLKGLGYKTMDWKTALAEYLK